MTNDWNGPQGSTPTEPDRWDSSWPGSASPGDRLRAFGYLEERFGIPARLFDDYMLFRRGDGWYLLKKCAHLETAGTLKVSKPGLRAFRSIGPYLKPTTRFIQIFGRAATKGNMVVNREQLADLLAGNGIGAQQEHLTTGYLILTTKGGHVLGLGFYGHGRVASQLPRKETGPLDELCRKERKRIC